MSENNQGQGTNFLSCGLMIAAPLFALLLFILASAFSGGGGVFRQSTNPTGENATDCANIQGKINNIPGAKQWVADAANSFLNGDQAILIALIEVESGWYQYAVNASPNSSASGLGQFQTGTAKGYKQFIGGKDGANRVWPKPSGNLCDKPTKESCPNDPRFEPERSIHAAAQLFGWSHSILKRDPNADIREAYKNAYMISYNTGGEAARPTAEKMIKYYDEMLASGDCKSSSTSQNNGVACGVIPISKANAAPSASVDARLMPPAANDFNNMATEFYQETGKKLPIASMFRSREDQIRLCHGINSKTKKCNNGNANVPGTSMHEAGLAIDFNLTKGVTKSSSGLNEQNYRTLISISGKYNWKVDNSNFGNSESWHFDYIALKDKYWYGEPKITNAISAANKTDCQK